MAAQPTTRWQFKVGDPVEVEAIDHTSDDSEGWSEAKHLMKSTPVNLHIRGWYLGEDETTIKLAMAKCGNSFGTVFHIVKGAIVRVKK